MLRASALFIVMVAPRLAAAERPFDPGGYYFPSDSVKAGDRWISSVFFDFLSYMKDGRPDYENPIPVPPFARLEISRDPGSDVDVIRCDSTDVALIDHDIAATFRCAEIGVVTIQGQFLFDGPFWDTREIGENTIVLVGSVATSGGKTQEAAFCFWEGD